MIGLLIGSLALTDLLLGLFVIPMDIIGQVIGFFENKYYCLVRTGCFVSLFGLSVLNVLVISVERYFAIAYPLKHMAYASQIKTTICWTLLLLWLSMLAMGLIPLLGWNTFVSETPCSITDVYIFNYQLFFSLVYTFGALANLGFIISVFGLVVFKILSNSHLSTNSHHCRKLRKMYFVLAISTSFVICWGPYSAITFIKVINTDTVSKTVTRWCLFPCIFNVGFNWMIYGLGHTKFRAAMTSIFRCTRFPEQFMLSRC